MKVNSSINMRRPFAELINRIYCPILGLTLLLASCFASQEKHIEVETIAEPPSALSPISVIVVDDSLPDPILLPYASLPESELQSATLGKTKLRGKQGMGLGALPGAYLHNSGPSGNTAKGDLLSMVLLLAGASAGGITGSAIGFVEGGTEDLIQIAVRIRDDKYSKEDIQEVYRALNTRELLVKSLKDASGHKRANSIMVVSESEMAARPNHKLEATEGVLHVKVLQIDFHSRYLGADASHEFVLAVSAEPEEKGGTSLPIKHFTYRSEPRLLSEWANGGPKLLRREHSLACREIAETMVAHFLPR